MDPQYRQRLAALQRKYLSIQGLPALATRTSLANLPLVRAFDAHAQEKGTISSDEVS
jgi:hypothetical protein